MRPLQLQICTVGIATLSAIAFISLAWSFPSHGQLFIGLGMVFLPLIYILGDALVQNKLRTYYRLEFAKSRTICERRRKTLQSPEYKAIMKSIEELRRMV